MDETHAPATRRNRMRGFAVAVILLAAGCVPVYRHFAEKGVLPADLHELHWMQLRSTFSLGPPPEVTDQSFVSLRRTTCFGYCPAYQVTVYGSGRVEYQGNHFVCDVGPRNAVIDRQDAAKLIGDLQRVGYFDIQWAPGNFATDVPTATTWLSIGTKTRKLCDYHGDDGVPRVMRRLEDTIDNVAGTARWLPRSSEGLPYCIDAAGSRHEVRSFMESGSGN